MCNLGATVRSQQSTGQLIHDPINRDFIIGHTVIVIMTVTIIISHADSWWRWGAAAFCLMWVLFAAGLWRHFARHEARRSRTGRLAGC